MPTTREATRSPQNLMLCLWVVAISLSAILFVNDSARRVSDIGILVILGLAAFITLIYYVVRAAVAAGIRDSQKP